MKQNLSYQVHCQVITAQTDCGEIVTAKRTEHQLLSATSEVSEVFADLYEQFRSPCLVGLQIVSIQNCQTKELQAA
ncbi:MULTISPECIES: hypothetical protein [Hymenobacter]|uniref:Uncharacterized protein n=1 Tax=Hymenobacter yonginensis TaxID=748197 RepID=A0ABY7PMK2_9BACT|nr:MULTISPECIES: hypothetical protein [Hymenobacter]AII51888.1 hypothetical protein N008_07830 [Hymenobacter sp. APR13]WBO84192.1 hypothetical protein O9Z63_17670 [Hymenobacter yonginensis]